MPTSSATLSTRRAPRGVALSLAAALATGGPAPARAQEPARAPAPLTVADEPADLALPPGLADDARELARAGRFAAAAVRFEAALAGTGDVRLLYHAGVARSQAGHHALAHRHFTEARARAGGLAATTVQLLDARVAAELALLIPVRLQLVRGPGGPPIDPSWLADGQVTVRSAAEPPESRVMFTMTGYGGQPLPLDPGPWIVQVRLRGHRPAELFGTVIPGSGEVTWQVALAPMQVPVDLRFSPASALRRAHLKLTSVGDPTPRVIERDLDQAALTLMLPVGTYQLDVTARRREAHTQLLIAPGQGPIAVELRRPDRRRSGERFDRDDKLMAGIGVLLLAELTAGAGLTLAGAVITSRALTRNERLLMSALVDDGGLSQVETSYPTSGFHRDLSRGMNFETAGLVTAFAAVGALIPALTVASRMRRRAAAVEIGVGAAMIAGGAVWLDDYLGRRDRQLGATDPTDRVVGPDLNRLNGHNVGASALLGLGISLAVLPAVALLTDRRKKRRWGSASLSPWTAPGQAGLALRGRF